MKPAARQGYQIGIFIAILLVGVLSLPRFERARAIGEANIGHDSLACQDCHKLAPGTLKQQFQANFLNFIGVNKSAVDLGYYPVSNTECFTCHDNPQDKHPVNRFEEFKIKLAISPQNCISCHQEHKGARVTTSYTFCSHCHKKLKIQSDPLDVTHQKLIAEKNWSSCLGCHDYHGNHIMELKTTFDEKIPLGEIIEYFSGGSSPYSQEKVYRVRENAID